MNARTLTSLPPSPLSYPAGATSSEPYRFRIVRSDLTNWVNRLLRCFPTMTEFFSPQSLAINAYPSTLGLTGFCPSVDTYLHAPTFFTALQLAAVEDRNVVLTAQPLVGADLLYRAIQERFPLPRKILWGSGGYYFPKSLEAFIRSQLVERTAEIHFLHSYGLGEVGHSLLCATERFSTGEPMFLQISDQIRLKIDLSSQIVIVNHEGKSFVPGDSAEKLDEFWRICSSSRRLDPRVKEELESWGTREWARRTGYLHAGEAGYDFQLRENVNSPDSDEQHYHLFWHQFGGSVTMKPKWSWCLNPQHTGFTQRTSYLRSGREEPCTTSGPREAGHV